MYINARVYNECMLSLMSLPVGKQAWTGLKNTNYKKEVRIAKKEYEITIGLFTPPNFLLWLNRLWNRKVTVRKTEMQQDPPLGRQHSTKNNAAPCSASQKRLTSDLVFGLK